ncbi:PKD domain-containing protein [[Eubacterium] cellulosolvens]
MRGKIVGLVICIFLLLSFYMGCIEDSGNGDKKKTNKPPHANAGGDLEVLTFTEVQFNSSNSSDPDGTIVSYSWDFGDQGNMGKDTSTETNPKYTYDFPGVYTVTLMVIDDKKSNATDTLTVTVKNRKPIVNICGDITANVSEIIDFTILANDIDGYMKKFAWDFNGDNKVDWQSASMIPTTHFYEAPGVYNAKLTVTDDYGEITTATKKITIVQPANAPPLASAGINQSVRAGQVMLKGSGFDGDGTIQKYEWDFNDDEVFDWSSMHAGVAYHEYTDEGDYQATLRVTDDLGLTATDKVTIKVNNSNPAINVSANILLNWISITGLDYLIMVNNTVINSELKIIIDDIATGITEELNGSSLTMVDQTTFKVTSLIFPMPKHSISLEVFYYKSLIGARVLDIINENHEFFGPRYDYDAIYNWDHLMEEHNRGGMETIRLKSIGDIAVNHIGDIYYYSLHGTGEYYMKNTASDGTSEGTINCTSMWVNVTIKDTTIISKKISISGSGIMTMTLGLGININLVIEKVRVGIENSFGTQNYFTGKGTFSGSTIDPNTGNVIPIEGDASLTSELLGFGFHKNWAGDEYPCGIKRSDLVLNGMTATPDSTTNFPVEMTMVNTTWEVDYETYSKNTIYYEYKTLTKMATLEIPNIGSVYPKDSPTTKAPIEHISDALSLNLPRPCIFLPGDSMAFASENGLVLLLLIEKGPVTKINNEEFETVVLNGSISGTAKGYFKITMISSDAYLGLAVNTVENYKWGDEKLIAEVSIKNIIL